MVLGKLILQGLWLYCKQLIAVLKILEDKNMYLDISFEVLSL